MKALVIVGAGLLLFTGQTAPQPARPTQQISPPPIAPGTSAIRGRIVDSLSNEPLSGIAVRLLFVGRPLASGATTTDDEGVYEFAAIAEGDYQVTVESSTHLPPAGLSRVTVFRDQRVGIDVRLTRGAVARGQVVDSSGKPITGATVRLGMPTRNAPFVPVRPIVTKSDGLFELAPLPAGEWQIEVDLPSTRDFARRPVVYYPGVISREEAKPIELAAGLVTDNITVVVPPITESILTVRVSSLAVIKDAAVTVIRPTPLMVRRVDLDSDGVGTIKGLLEERYFVAVSQTSENKHLVAFQVVDFVPPSWEVHLALQPAGRITGRIVAQRGGLPPLTGVRVAASWVHNDVEINPVVPDQTDAGPDGTFRIDGLFGMRRLELIALSADWRVHSILQGRFDVTNGVEVPLDATVDVTIVVARR